MHDFVPSFYVSSGTRFYVFFLQNPFYGEMFLPSFQVFPQNHQVLLCGFALPGNWGEFAEICNEGLAATENSSKNRENFDFYHIQNLSLVIHIYINLSGERIFLGLGRAWSCQWRVHRSLSSKPAAGPRPGGAPAKLSNSNSGRSDAFFFLLFFWSYAHRALKDCSLSPRQGNCLGQTDDGGRRRRGARDKSWREYLVEKLLLA